MILVKKASWSASRFTGLILYFISLTSLVGAYQGSLIGFFDLHIQATAFFGSQAMVLIFLVMFFASLYMTVRISYRTLLSKARSSIPSLRSFRDAVLPPDEEEEVPL